MKRDPARLAAAIAVFYVLFFVSGIFVYYFATRDSYTLKFSLTLPSTWVAAILSLSIAWGLWHHYRWA